MSQEASLTAEAYKGTASIIQGVLIALSAVIAVVGYRIQARLARQQHVREHELKETKSLLKNLVGPAQGYAYTIDIMWLHFICNFVFKGEIEQDDWNGAFAKVTGDPKSFGCFMKGISHLQFDSFVGKDKEEEIRANPESELAIEYRRFVRRLLWDGFRPLALLLKDFNIFPVPSIAAFKSQYPFYASSFSLRKTIFMETLSFVSELEYLVSQEWDVEKKYEKLFPIAEPWCRGSCGYLAGQVTSLKARIEMLTDAKEDKDNTGTDPKQAKEVQRMNKAVEERGKREEDNGVSSSSRYVATVGKEGSTV